MMCSERNNVPQCLLFFVFEAQWKEEIREQLEKIKSDGSCYPQHIEEELIRRRRQELRSVNVWDFSMMTFITVLCTPTKHPS